MSAKASTAKYVAFELRSRTDGRVRDSIVYHTASTGRFGGAGEGEADARHARVAPRGKSARLSDVFGCPVETDGDEFYARSVPVFSAKKPTSNFHGDQNFDTRSPIFIDQCHEEGCPFSLEHMTDPETFFLPQRATS